MQHDEEKIEFRASLPPIQSAIQINGMGDGALVKLDVPQSDIEAVLRLQSLAGMVFIVTIKKDE
ncbi:MAG: hypothetical protein PHW73_01370 [Atribacterota bacterium]|nr:hypothetical protein [Atribacterota bacterium]